MNENNKTTWITHKLYKAEIINFLRSVNVDFDTSDEDFFYGFAEKFIDGLRNLIAKNENELFKEAYSAYLDYESQNI